MDGLHDVDDGLVRISAVHYNSLEDVAQLKQAMDPVLG